MTDDRLLLVGEAPSRRGRGPLVGPSGARLADLLGVTLSWLESNTERVNVLAANPGPVAPGRSGDLFPIRLARAQAARLLPLMRGRRTLVLGRRAASAIDPRLGQLPYMAWTDDLLADVRVALLPHPSGANRFWNSRDNRELARRFVADALGLPSGAGSLDFDRP